MSESYYITGNTKILCVIGHPIVHSMSPTMHNAAIQELRLDHVYVAFDVNPNNLKKAMEGLKALGIKGINVTIPHKETIIKYLDEIDLLGRKIGAINTIKNENGRLIGRNTDATGGKKALLDAGCEISGKNILIVGAGGAARALSFILAEDANKIIILNRTEERAIKLANDVKESVDTMIEGKHYNDDVLKNDLKDMDILINTTPVGMFPDMNESPVPKKFLHEDLFVFDIIYNPLETRLIKEAHETGCKALGGLDMLVNQGALAFEWWTGKKPNINLMKNKIIACLGLR